jgi:hypothetical protein
LLLRRFGIVGPKEDPNAQAAAQCRLSKRSARNFLRNKVVCKPYSVLGTQLTGAGVQRIAPLPSANVVIVDPAGLPYVSGARPASQAGAASGSIYAFLALKDFPVEVTAGVKKTGDAVLHRYSVNERDQYVIHTVGEDFRSGVFSSDAALSSLAKAYFNVLKQFALHVIRLPPTDKLVLRLLPISGGVFAANFGTDMHHLTFAALSTAYESLDDGTLEALDQHVENVEMCIFLDREFDQYETALDWRKA